MVKSILKKIIPASQLPLLNQIAQQIRIPEMIYTKSIFSKAMSTPRFLPEEYLPELQKKYPALPEYRYDSEALLRRGQHRAQQVLKMIAASGFQSFAEIGCGDGMVSYCLKTSGKDVSAVDFTETDVDQRALDAGIDFRIMNASKLQFPDERFDVLYSYNAFEHFTDPQKVLEEFIRVVKRNGYIYLNFGPLYYSPWGEHAYRSITIPYCQFLFPKDTLNAFAQKHDLHPIEAGYVNGLSSDDYRYLFTSFSSRLSVGKYVETVDYSHLKLIRKYPSCFKSKSGNFMDFVISGIEVLFKKK